ncbi:acyl carrier protein [Spirillospora sp. NPDC046719]
MSTPFLPYLGAEPLAPEPPLRDMRLDSMQAIELMFALEDAFGIRLPEEVLVEETFRTAGNLLRVTAQFMSRQSLGTLQSARGPVKPGECTGRSAAPSSDEAAPRPDRTSLPYRGLQRRRHRPGRGVPSCRAHGDARHRPPRACWFPLSTAVWAAGWTNSWTRASRSAGSTCPPR